jgi:hypothetical protein
MPGDLALGMILWEYQVHVWDLAVATGQPWTPPADATEVSLVFAPGMLTEDYQGEGKGLWATSTGAYRRFRRGPADRPVRT